MSAFWLLLPIFLPIIGGGMVLVFQFDDQRDRDIYCECLAVVTSILVWILLFRVNRDPVEIYSFARGFNVTLRVDGMAMLFTGMVSIMWPLVLLYAFSYMWNDKKLNIFFGFYMITYGVTLGIAFSANITTMYVFYEMLSLVTIPLVTHYGDHESMFAGRTYAAYTIGGASLTFFAVVVATMFGQEGIFLYGGSLNAGVSVRLMRVAFLFGFFGFGTKAAIFPLFNWLPTASVAPTPVTALLHAVAVVNSGAFAVMRITWYVFGPDILRGSKVHIVCLMTSVFTLVFAAVMALRQRHFKRRLAFSTVSNLSYMLFGCMLLTPAGFEGGIAHLLMHGVIKMSLFLCAGAFMHVTGRAYIYELNGIGKKMPVTFTCYTLGALSLTGIPLFAGFVSKWQLLTAAASEGTALGVIGAFGLIIAAFLCAMYTLTVSVRAFFPMSGKDLYAKDTKVHEADALMLTPIVFFTLVNLVIGFASGPIMTFLEKIAEGLM